MNDIMAPEGRDLVVERQRTHIRVTAVDILLDERLYLTVERISVKMSKAVGITPEHLIGKQEACFAVAVRALTWGLDPWEVARKTYVTPGGAIGYMGALIISVINSSPRIVGGLRFEHYGDWSKLAGKWVERTSQKGNKYEVPTWTDDDAKGLGVQISARLRDEDTPRTFNFDLVQAYPRNSTLWARDPRTQLVYTAARRFGSVVVPELLIGVPEDDGPSEVYMGELRTVEPEPEIAQPAPLPAQPQETVDQDTGEVHHEEKPKPERQGGRITEQQKGTLTKMLNDRDLTARFLEAFDLDEPGELPMTKMNEAMAWIREQSPA